MGIMIFFAMAVSIGIHPAQADTVSSIGIATYLPIGGKVEDGDIITAIPRGYIVTTKEYDPGVVGVVTKNPAIALKTSKDQPGLPVVNVGSVYVKVTGINGNIKRGDFITSSTIPGAGMKSTRNGYVIGEALEGATFGSPKDVKTINVNLNLRFLQAGSPQVSNSLLNILSLSSLAAYEEPLSVFKYVISAIVLLMSFGFGFIIFSRTIHTGIEAIGRNPLAGRMIQLSILFNVILVIIVIMAGIGIVWIFLRI